MSIWTSDREIGRLLRPVFFGLALLPLAGCLAAPSQTGAKPEGASPFGFLSIRKPDTLAPADDGDTRHAPVMRRATLADGAVIVVPPPGYCIDGDSLAARRSGGFALLGSCEVLTGRRSGVLAEPAVITVAVLRGRGEAPDAATLGRALGKGRVLDRIDGDGLALVHLKGGGEDRVPGSDTRHWRGVMEVNGYLVGLALYGAQGGEVTTAKGGSLLIMLAEEIREASPVVAFSPDSKPQTAPDAIQTEPAETSEGEGAKPPAAKKGLKNLFGRLFS